jgi:hypothetical protein
MLNFMMAQHRFIIFWVFIFSLNFTLLESRLAKWTSTTFSVKAHDDYLFHLAKVLSRYQSNLSPFSLNEIETSARYASLSGVVFVKSLDGLTHVIKKSMGER